MRYTLQSEDTNQHPHISRQTATATPKGNCNAAVATFVVSLSAYQGERAAQGQAGKEGGGRAAKSAARTNQINYLRIYSNKVVDKPTKVGRTVAWHVAEYVARQGKRQRKVEGIERGAKGH